MVAIFFVFFLLGTNVHAGYPTTGLVEKATTPATSTLSFDEDAELTKIAESCFSSSNFEQLSGNIVRRTVARILGNQLIGESVTVIGLAELRKTLNLEPLPPWKHYNVTDPSESELASAPTIQAYYDLKEPRSEMRSLDSYYLYEHNLSASIAYLDNRFPAIRKIFRRRLEEIRQSGKRVINRKTVDRMIDGFLEVLERVDNAVSKMTLGRNHDCWDD